MQKFKLSATNWKREPGPNVLNAECKHCGACSGVSTKFRQLLAWRGERWACTIWACTSFACPVAPQHIPLPGTAQKAFQEHKSSQKLSEPF